MTTLITIGIAIALLVIACLLMSSSEAARKEEEHRKLLGDPEKDHDFQDE